MKYRNFEISLIEQILTQFLSSLKVTTIFSSEKLVNFSLLLVKSKERERERKMKIFD